MGEILKSSGSGSEASRRLALLEALLREQRPDLQVPSGFPRRAPDAEVPLSFGEEQLWLFERIAPGTAAYNLAFCLRFTGALDLAALWESLGDLTARHEALRCSYPERDAHAVRQVAATTTVPRLLVDVSGLLPAARATEALRLSARAAARPFDLGRGPLLRALLLDAGPGDHRLVTVLHHIVADGWSVELFQRELAALYTARAAGTAPSLAEPVQYGDFALWQRRELTAERIAERVAYWRRLEGMPTALELPLDRRRPSLPSYRGALVSLRLPAPSVAALRELVRRSNASLFVVLLTTFKALLLRITGSSDLAVGSAVACRERPGLEGAFGFFLNTLVLRTDLSEDPSCLDALARVRETVLGALAHQDLPFDVLVEALEVSRDPSRQPLFQTSFTLRREPPPIDLGGGLEVALEEVDNGAAKWDLTAETVESPRGGLAFSLRYARDLFDRATVLRLAESFQVLLTGAAERPAMRLSDLPLLSLAERHQIGYEWNDTGVVVPAVCCVSRLIEERVARDPERVALSFAGSELTYGELDARADALARRLRARGVGAEDLVAVSVERSPEMVVAVLGVLKSGAAYVPLDPSYPRERRSYVLADSGARVVLTESGVQDDLVGYEGTVLCLDRLGSMKSWPVPAVPVVGENLAYVLYTSGSTGRPKGVGISRRALLNFLAAMRERPGVAEGDVLLAVTSLSFDIAGLELFLPLLVGARVELASREEAAEGERLRARLESCGATLMQATPATWRMLLQSGWQGSDELKVLCGGESLAEDLAAELRLRSREVWNLYGPTETTVWSSVARVEHDGAVLVGRPIANTRVELLSSDGSRVPAGVVGELCLGGEGLARGYLGRPELTAERFVPDGISGARGERLYRTGDLARWRPDGSIELLGRIDHQVKVRGFRIEPGEIESALRSHAGVLDAVVSVRGDGADRRLVAYLVPAVDGTATSASVREHLERTLPDYMVPSAFVWLSALPLTPNGKVDRKALPAPESAAEPGGAGAVETPVAELLAGIWCEVLGLDRVGPEDHFFHLGGHSLNATQVVSRVQSALGVELPLRTLFEVPRLSKLARRVEGALGRGERSTAPALVVVPRSGPLPLSFAQERLWFLERLEPGQKAYHIPVCLRLSGSLNVWALARCFDELCGRHETLRTSFELVESSAVQRIWPPARRRPAMVDLGGLPGVWREGEGRRLFREEAGRTFDLERGPLVRFCLVRLGECEHLLLLTLHHIVTDGWSMGVLFGELAALYEAFESGLSSPLPQLGVQYVDFAVWQRAWLRGEVLGEQLGYWRERLAGLPPVLELPTDRPRPALQSFAGAAESSALGTGLGRSVSAVARRLGATSFMVYLSAFQSLLSRLTGGTDVFVGTPIANRSRPEIEGLIGFFANTLVMRADLGGDPTFAETVERVRTASLGAYAHQDLPFEKLVKELRPERSLAASPLFQVMFLVQEAGVWPELAGLETSAVPLETKVSKFDLTLVVDGTGGELLAAAGYRTDLFDRATVSRLLGHFRRLLEAALADPSCRLSDLPLLSLAERHQIAHEWNDTLVAVPEVCCLSRWIEERVARDPERVALSFEGSELTYGELDARANALARRLSDFGVGAEDFVAVSVERSPEMVVAVLGVLKSGAAYVPLDPAYPCERRAYVLADSGARVVLTESGVQDDLVGYEGTVLCLDRLESVEPWSGPAVPVLAENLAYVLYTSGSTGRPKGVGISRRALLNFLVAMRERPGVVERDVLLAVTSLSFDIAGLELFLPLLVGARVELASRGEAAEGERLRARLESCGATLMQATPATWRMLLQSGWQGSDELKVLCGGESLAEDLAAELRLRSREVWNLYGPTETTVWSLVARVEHDGAVLVGRPIANTRVELLSSEGRPVPTGVVGELYLGGEGLARGYLGRPDLTAERFVPDGCSGARGERLYRTGDLARWRPDGSIELLGRIDHQVKVRGFRIELGEIESALRSHAGVLDAVVSVRGEGAERRLVAYLVPAGEGTATSASVREHLERTLPDYMVPSAFVWLSALPLTPNGKVDRKALPAPEEAAEPAGAGAVETPVAELLAGIWCEVLGLEQVGADDHFFHLGGHSLNATQVVSRVESSLGVELPLRALFEAPRLTELARRLEGALRRGERSTAPALVRVPRSGPLPLSFAQERLWFLERLEPGQKAYHIPVCLRLSGSLNVWALARCFDELCGRHETLRTSFELVESSAVQRIWPPARRRPAMVDLGGLPGVWREGEGRRLFREEAGRTFDLERGPLVRFCLVRLGECEHLLLLTLHHIVTDGWSMGVLFRELAALYGSFESGLASPLPQLGVQYVDFAVWQREWLRGEVLGEQLGYWRERLAGLPPVLELPTDRPRPALQSFAGAAESSALGTGVGRSVSAVARRLGATSFMVYLSAFQSLLSRLTGGTDVFVGTPIANRSRPEIEGLIGFFANTLVLRIDLGGDPSFAETVERVRTAALGAYAHQDLPFEKLVEELRPERSLASSPLFQVMFLVQEAGVRPELVGLETSAVALETRVSKFDLTLVMDGTGKDLLAAASYRTDLFDHATIWRLLGHFRRLLEGALADPSRRLSELPLLSLAERHQIGYEWNDTEVCGHGPAVHRRVAAEAELRPEGLALCWGEERLTYRGLDELSNRLAHLLRALGVGPEVPVAVLLDRSPALAAAALGVLKAGGAYLPLDPAQPVERLSWILAEARTPVVLSRRDLLADLLPLLPDVEVVLLDAETDRLQRCSSEPVRVEIDGSSMAYVIYTSGSTGRPKGVVVPHSALANLVEWHLALYSQPGDVATLIASTGFDASVWELWSCLAAGATLSIPDSDTAASPALLRHWLDAQSATLSFLPTPLAEAVLADPGPAPASLRVLLTGGDVLRRRPIEGCPFTLVNHYGPTESAVVATWAPVPASAAQQPPIGRPISNVRAYVLDSSLHPVPTGVAGELYLGGSSLARGYLSRPDWTAERFLPAPFTSEPGGRLYRTGDSVRWLPDGRLEFLGRLDHQVKVRGFRIELEEIEAALCRRPGVQTAVVVVRGTDDGDRHLIAYVVPRSGERLEAAELRSGLAEHLPGYMVPAFFSVHDALPLLPNGKVDRKALPDPEAAQEPASARAPQAPVAELLAGIWSEVLGLEHVGPDDHFFHLGGHSLNATQVVSRAQSTLGVDLPLRTLFESPRLSELARRVEGALRRGERSTAPALVVVPRSGPLPLSFAQERLWFLERLEPGQKAYHIPVCLRLTGSLNVWALAQAFDELCRRHETLRTSFELVGSSAVQRIWPSARRWPAMVDLGDLPGVWREGEGGRLFRQEAGTTFDLERGPLVRLRLVRLGEWEHLLLLTLHHIVTDGWSMGVLFRELAALYGAFVSGLPSPLPQLGVQYVDFAVWQREWLQGAVLGEQLGYWRERLAGLPPVLELPTDRPRPALQSFAGAAESSALGTGLGRSVSAVARRLGATSFMVYLSAFQSLLSRLTGGTDVFVGTPIANRSRPEIEGLIGFFANTLVMRADLGGDPTFAETVERVRTAALGAYAYQDLPFEKLVEELRPERSLASSPLFQVMFLVQEAGVWPELAGLETSAVALETKVSKFDLTLVVDGTGGELLAAASYRTDLFDRATVWRLLGHFRRLLEAALADPSRRLSDLPLLSSAERHQVAHEWNDTLWPAGPEVCLHELFEAQVERTPEATALSAGSERLSYRELDMRAQRLASRLRAQGVGPEVRVGICLDRSAEMVVALVGVLKAGGAYVPLDPAYPRERLLWTLEHCGATVVLTCRPLAARLDLAEGTRTRLLFVDEAPAASEEISRPEAPAAGNLAYVIYTSGSTGRPKGVAIEHRSAVALVRWAGKVFSADELRGVCAATSIGFDLSVFELFVPLAHGGAVILVEDALALAELSEAGGVSLLNTVPSALSELLRLGAVPPSVRTINLAGEPLRRELADRAHELPGIERVLNLYGPSEDTTYSTFTTVPRSGGEPSIGRPVAGTRVYLLDGALQPVPARVPGELFLAGDGLARGYLGRPDLTAERFVPDPFSTAGGRLYRTGDLARLRADGELEFLGRLDHQVKVRGFRIELEEIEAALCRRPGVQTAVVVVHGADESDRHLTAYVVPRSGERLEAADLRSGLAEHLPGYMVPTFFSVHDALPLTPNGKVDRKALPDPETAQEPASAQAAQTPVAELLAGIWSEVLGLEQVGPDAHFFHLGGHSLRATSVVARIRQVLGAEVPLRALFEEPTLAGLTRTVEAALGRGPRGLEPPLTPVSRPGELPLSFSQERLWFLDQLEPGSALLNLGFAVRLHGTLVLDVLESSLGEIVRRHESLRTTFHPAAGWVGAKQVVSAPMVRGVPMVELGALPAGVARGESDRLAREELRRPFDLARGPLMRWGLLRLSAAEHRLCITAHHIAVDGWSMSLFVDELTRLYEALLDGRPAALPELPVQYADFAVWQRQSLSDEVLEEQLVYWRQQLAGAPPLLELPTDRPRPSVQSFRGGSHHQLVPRDLADAVRALGHREGATLFMVLLTTFDVLLGRHAGQRDVLVGSPVAGRHRPEVENLIGCFLNTLVLRTDLSGTPTFSELVAQVREASLGAFAHQDLPFERLLEALEPARDLSHTPLFQVFFNVLNFPERQLRLPGLALEIKEVGEIPSKFDLTLYVHEGVDGIGAHWVYNADLFDDERIACLADQLEHLLRQAVADPWARIHEYSLVTPRFAALLPDPTLPLRDTWMGAVHQGLSRSAARAPLSEAVRDRTGSWTYAELEARANQLGRFLIAGGVTTGDLVAVYAHRSGSLVWAMMGVLKAGAAFLILDPAYPPQRLAEYVRIGCPTGCLGLREAGPPPCALEEALLEVGCGCRLELPPLAAAASATALAALPTTDPVVPVGPNDAACLTFTSGSTGKPKGVLGLHGSLSHFHPWLGQRFGFDESDRFGMLSALAHDPLQRDIFTPLWFGASIHIPDPDRIGDAGFLAEWVRQGEMTTLNLTPATMGLLIDAAEDGAGTERGLPSLRRAFVVGDALRRSEVARLQALAPDLTVVNLYGATETQRAVAGFEVPRPEEAAARSLGKEVLPLGRGFEDVQLVVLNEAGRLAGIGELGEIHVRSPHLARGYLGDETLTAERFRTNPFTGTVGDRIYRTGDLGRYRSDGDVEPSGRSDVQIKIRGFRIEPGEVEAALLRHPGVRACVMVAREDGSGDRRLVAYLVTTGATQVPTRELRAFIADLLPDFMIPSAFVVLPELPLSPAGKVDRRALPAPDSSGTETLGRAEPRTPAEELAAGIWAELLGVQHVGPHDSFFELGGHSLLATRLVSRIRDVTGIELPLRSIFEAPTMGDMAEAIERRLREGTIPPAPPILPLPHRTEPPLSFAQQRLWFLDQLEPGSSAYNLSIAVRLSGRLDLPALWDAIAEITRRHEILRTTFAEREDDPVQVIAPAAPPALTFADLEAIPEIDRDREMHLLAGRDVQRPFDLVRGPLVRALVLRMDGGEHALVISMHHIVTDGWSLGVFLRELAAVYAASVAGGSPLLPELPIQYADFAAWQRGWLQGEVLEAQLGFWTGQLAGVPPMLELPTDRPRPVVQTHRGGKVSVEIPPELTERLEAIGGAHGATLFMTLYAAFSVLLSRFAGQEEVVIGVPVANRGRTELEDMIGLFANTLALRTDLKGDPTFVDLILRVREVALGAYVHQDLPFEKLIAELQPQRDLGRSPLFQVMFTLQNAPRLQLELPGLSLSALSLDNGRAPFDLTLSVTPLQKGLLVRLEHNRDLFDESTAHRLAGHYRHLLLAIADGRVRRVSELPLLARAERDELLAIDTGAVTEVPSRLVHQLFERQAERSPDAVAVSFEGASLSYGELNRRADRLADRLRRLGVRPEVRVGLCLGRSLDLLVGLLGVLKAGGAYVPLDPAYPPSRLALVMEDAGIRVLLDDGGPLAAIPAHGVQVLAVAGADYGGSAEECPVSPGPLTGVEGLAYVIYTSGSTGRPKGVEIPHRSIVNFLLSMAGTPGLSRQDVLIAITTISFDIAVLELFLPLAVGARIELAGRETAADGERLAALLETSQATVLQATPATWRMLLDSSWRGEPRLKALCGGEALPRDLADRLRARVGALWNVYGPTETTVWSAARLLGTERWFVPIGGPLANTELHVVDRHLELVPTGIAGELVIGGEGLARGYLGQPDLTAERFVPDPFDRFGGRLYRTGDLVRRRPSGDIEFCGRLDHQVKVRGFRIEVAEVEGSLARHPAVREAVVAVREDRRGDRILTTYVVFDGEPCTPAELRVFLRQQLPEYMIPTAFVPLTTLPRTPNGKIDRKALPALDQARSASAPAFVPPRTEIERLITNVWQEVLGIEEVGLRHNFFDLGGHSLLLVRVLGRLRTVLSRSDLTLVQLFNYPDVDSLARFLTEQQDEAAAVREAQGRARQQLEGRSRRRQVLSRIKAVSQP